MLLPFWESNLEIGFASAAIFNSVLSIWVYIWVVFKFSCPSTSWTVLTSTPLDTIRVAAVWRSLCAENWLASNPAASICFFTSRWTADALIRWLSRDPNKARLSDSIFLLRSTRYASMACRQDAPKYTIRSLLPFPTTRIRSSYTSERFSPTSSLRRMPQLRNKRRIA